MTPRFILGKRQGPEYGVFVAPPGVDPSTASASRLLLAITNFIDQIILIGVASSLPQTIPLGLTSYTPTVFLRAFTYMYDTGLVGIARPFPNYWQQIGATSATVSPSSLAISGGSPKSIYTVFNRAAP